jgi:hypothetical protein
VSWPGERNDTELDDHPQWLRGSAAGLRGDERKLQMRTTKAALGAAFLSAALLIAGCGQSGSQSGTDPATAGGASPAPEGEAGNGISEKSPKEIFEAAEAALLAVESVRVKMDVTDAGNVIKGDLKLTKDNDMSGWMEQEGVRMNLIVKDGTVYLRSRELWAQESAEAAELFGNRWVMMDPSTVKDMGTLTDVLSIKALTKSIFDELNKPAFLSKSEETVGGQQVVRLKAVDGFIEVMATGEPYPVRLDGKTIGKDEGGSIRFSDFGKDFKIKAPANPLDPTKLGG